jgi:Cullin family
MQVHLSKRLLGQRSVSDEYERNMIARLKAECGYQVRTHMYHVPCTIVRTTVLA